MHSQRHAQKWALIAVLLVTTLLQPISAAAHSEGLVDSTCPLDGTTFKALVNLSGTEAGRRLDFKPLGPTAAPWRLPVCPTCNFVLFGAPLTDAQKTALRTFVASPDYQAWAKTYPSYFLVGQILHKLSAPEEAQAWAFLQASWQADGDARTHKACLAQSLTHYQRFLETHTSRDEARVNAQLLAGEILRQMGDFAQAKAWFENLGQKPEFQDNPQRTILKYQLALIAEKDAAPKEMPEMEVTQADIEKDPVYKLLKGMKGFDALLQRFEFIRWSDNFPQGFQVQLRPKNNPILANVWWFVPLTQDGAVAYDWSQFAAAYERADAVISKHVWLKTWLSSGDKGAPPREVLLYMTGLVPRMLGYRDGENDYGFEGATLLEEWRDAKLSGKPRYEIGLYEGPILAKVYLSDEDSRALIFYHYPHDEDVEFGSGSHWLDRLDVRSPVYIVVTPDGKKKIQALPHS